MGFTAKDYFHMFPGSVVSLIYSYLLPPCIYPFVNSQIAYA